MPEKADIMLHRLTRLLLPGYDGRGIKFSKIAGMLPGKWPRWISSPSRYMHQHSEDSFTSGFQSNELAEIRLNEKENGTRKNKEVIG